jgi:hypothetical protein
MPWAFENTRNKQHKHSHAIDIGEYTEQTTNNINILMLSAFENTQNKQHKHSHATNIGEYIAIACKDAPSLLVTQPHAPCSYTLPTLHSIVRITHPTDAKIQNFWLTKE